MSPIILVLLAFLSTVVGVRPGLQQSRALSVLQSQTMQLLEQTASPDQACTDWLSSPSGVLFTQCSNITDAIPSRTSKNNCTLNATDYDNFCNNSCYDILLAGYNYILTGPCLAFFDSLWAPCNNDTACGDNEICYQGTCYSSCKSISDCNSCSETCASFPQRNSTACQPRYTNATSNSTTTFRGTVYALNSYCVKNAIGDYCSVLVNSLLQPNLSSLQCTNFTSWGCCLGTILGSDQYCQYRIFNNSAIYGCANSGSVCSPLPSAQSFCAANSSSPITSSISSLISSIVGNVTSSLSSGLSSSSGVSNNSAGSSITIGVPGKSSVGVVIYPNGTIGTGKSGNGAGKENAPWLLVLGLMCTLLFSSN